jgi:hypothetical protein
MLRHQIRQSKLRFAEVPIYENGQIIKGDYQFENPPPDEILDRGIGATSDGKEDWSVIGTKKEAEAAHLALGEYMSQLNRLKDRTNK